MEDQLQEFKDSNEEQVQAEVERRLQALRTECEERVQEALEQQRSAEKLCQGAQESTKQAQFMADRVQTQLFEASTKYEERISRLVAENALLAESTQRLQLSLAEVEAQLAHLQQQGASEPSAPLHTQPTSSHTAYEHIITQLTEEARVLESQLRMEKMAHEKDVKELQHQIQVEHQAVASLQKEMKSRVSKEENDRLKHRVRLLQKIAFQNAEEDGEDSISMEQEPESTLAADESKSLEDLLVQRIQSLDHDLTQSRIALTESKQQEHSLRSSIDTLKASLEASSELVKRLEHDLEQRSNALEQLLSQRQVSTAPVRSQMQDLVDLLESDEPKTKLSPKTTVTAGSGGPGTGEVNNQMIGWLQSQRDKYKEKLAQAEASLMRSQQQFDNLQSRYGQLEHDNVQLYSRIKYLQTLSGSTKRSMRDAEEGRYGDDELEGRYSSMYEQRMNPFTEVSGLSVVHVATAY